MMRCLVFAMLTVVVSGCAPIQHNPIEQSMVRSAFAGRPGGFVLMDTWSSHVLRVDEPRCAEPLPPCSTFKVWNTMIALELGLVSSPDEAFYIWDGQKRFLDDWNQDLTLARAFAVSCVPAFQSLAERIGLERMRQWLERIHYGDLDISAGMTAFWLPRPGRKTIVISADEQAKLLRRLLRDDLPFSEDKVLVLREIMRVRTTAKGELFGKTGTGRLGEGPEQVAWFVGWVESQADGKKRVFACVVRGDGLTGLDVRAMVERILEAGGLL
jgi:beta-lactamase class D